MAGEPVPVTMGIVAAQRGKTRTRMPRDHRRQPGAMWRGISTMAVGRCCLCSRRWRWTQQLRRHALRETLEQQIALGDPPETKETFARLIQNGIAEDDVWRLLALVLVDELNEIARNQRPFDRVRYVAALNALPQTPKALS